MVLWLASCMMVGGDAAPEMAPEPTVADAGENAKEDAPKPSSAPAARAEAGPSGSVSFDGNLGLVGGLDTKDAEKKKPEEEERGPGGGSDGAERVRTWFPEAFLWQPMVETDASGVASVDVRVPDQLTTWRVLGLAHTRDGHQAGAVVTFDSRLPAYVDPVVPGWLYAGDRLTLPVQVANTSDSPLTTVLTVEATGPLRGNGGGTVTVVPGGSIVRSVDLRAEGAGRATVSAVLSGTDAVIREIPVTPSGRPVTSVRGGLVSGEREIPIAGVPGADPSTGRLTVLVFPGPTAVLQAELERPGDAGSATSAAYGFAVTSAWKDLAARTGVALDEKTLRRKQIVAWQRVVPYGRSPDGAVAADLLLGMGTVDGELATALRDRLVQTLVSSQNGDGSWTRQSQGTVQQLLVQTALAARSLPESATGARFRARGAIARNAAAIRDGYTAAVVLSSGLVEGDARKPLEDLVIAATTDEDGRRVVVPARVLNAWGQSPSEAEMTAFAAVALSDRADLDWRGDLVARLMSGYDADRGFGAGGADPIALDAVLRQLPGVDQPVDVALSIDGAEVARAKLDPAQPKVPAVLTAAPGGGGHRVKLTVGPKSPALAWVATTEDWVAWTGDERLPGVDVTVQTPALRVGRDADLLIGAAGPSGVQLEITQGLAPGMTVDEAALSSISDRVVSHRILQDRVVLTTRPFAAGEAMTIPVRVTPAFAGTFSTPPLHVEAIGGGAADLAPAVLAVAP